MSTKKPVMSHDPLADLDGDSGNDAMARHGTAPAAVAGPEPGADDATVTGNEGNVLLLPSALTIAEVGELYPTMSERLQQGGELTIDCSEVEAIDGAGLQLLAALNKSAIEHQLPIKWQGATATLQRAIAEMGLSDLLEVA
jgi:anti-anti-sigma regulatory factor